MSAPILELHEVRKRYPGVLALDGVSLRIEPGQCFGLIGPNGAGKTTTFAVICGFIRQDAGQVEVLGRPVRRGAFHGKLGVLPQDSLLPPQATVGELLVGWARLGRLSAPEEQARAALRRVGLEESWDLWPASLSHGMAKRVAIAQALMGDPPLVLLDEPTAGLDPKIAAQVRSAIRELKGRQTVLISSHNLTELEELCDAAAVLDHGKVVQAGSMETLTGRASELTVQIARGNVPLPELRQLAGITEVRLEPSGALVVRFDAGRLAPEEAVSAVIGVLLARGVLFRSVTPGRRLEARVLELT